MEIEQYVEPFIEVCTLVFKRQGKIDITAKRPYIVTKDSVKEWDISGVIGFSGEARGAVVISMKNELAMKLVDALTGTPHKEVDDEVVDIIGEFINIIAGLAKQRLENSFSLIISLPSIVLGREHSVWWPGDNPRVICIPFTIFEDDTFILSVTLESL